jgi:ribonuclease P/MRP protein subunit RPP40
MLTQSQADLIIPEEVFALVQQKLLTERPIPGFKKVVLSLHDILSGDFFTEYIKKGETQTQTSPTLTTSI